MSSNETIRAIGIIIEDFLPYRGLKLDESQDLNPDNINTKLTNYHFYRITAQRIEPRGHRKWVFIYVLSNDSSKTTQTPAKNKPKLVDLLNSADTDPKYKDLDELIIIAPQSFFGKKPLLDTMEMISNEKGIKTYDPTGEKPYYNAYPYNIFVLNLPEHVEVPRHEIVPMDGVVNFMRFERLSKMDSLPKILSSDPPVVWLGARDGQIVKIYRPSETTLETIVYRRVFSIARSMPISS